MGRENQSGPCPTAGNAKKWIRVPGLGRAHGRRVGPICRKRTAKKSPMLFSSFMAACLLLVATATTGFAYSEEIKWLRNQSFKACPNYYVWRLIDNYFPNAQWESDWSDEGDYIVNVHGDMFFKGREVAAQLQFTIDPKRDKFDINALEFDGRPQSKEMRVEFVKAMCQDVQ
jgi:hypothetical protein